MKEREMEVAVVVFWKRGCCELELKLKILLDVVVDDVVVVVLVAVGVRHVM